MNLPKAIELLTHMTKPGCSLDRDDALNALKLGIEALNERLEAIRQGLPLWHEKLPGED